MLVVLVSASIDKGAKLGIIPQSMGDYMRYAIALIPLLAIAGCQTKQLDELNYSERKALAQELVKRCQDQGVKPGTPEMTVCTKAEVQAEYAKRQKEEAWRRGFAASMANGMQNASNAYGSAAANTRSMNTSVTCNTYRNGPYAQTRCY